MHSQYCSLPSEIKTHKILLPQGWQTDARHMWFFLRCSSVGCSLWFRQHFLCVQFPDLMDGNTLHECAVKWGKGGGRNEEGARESVAFEVRKAWYEVPNLDYWPPVHKVTGSGSNSGDKFIKLCFLSLFFYIEYIRKNLNFKNSWKMVSTRQYITSKGSGIS